MRKNDIIQSMGHVNVAIIGSSNSGKSTLVNALCGRFLVPECSHTSTIVTTYLGNIPSGINECALLSSNGKLISYSYEDFQNLLVYSDEIYNNLKSRYVDRSAFVNINHPLASSGIVLIDTIGTGVNGFDTQRSSLISKQSDMVIYLYDASKGANLTLSEIEFLKRTLFPKDKKTLLPCDRIFFVPNKIDGVSSVMECVNTLKHNLKLLVSPNAEEYNQLCNNVIPISALYFRIATSGTVPLYGCDSYKNQEAYKIASEISEYEKRIKNKYSTTLYEMSNVINLIDRIIDVSKKIHI